MSRMADYLRIVRPVNLAMMLLTQALFWWFVVEPNYAFFHAETQLSVVQVILLMACTALIAAGGYVINDYYDLPIDLVNKPERVIVSKGISDAAAFNYYGVLTGAGIVCGAVAAWLAGRISLVLFPVVMAGLLWFYAQLFKRWFLFGNLIVGVCTASVILILLFFEINWSAHAVSPLPETNEILRYGRAYLIFAFLTTLFREAIKDLEDREGDARFDCRTVPVVLGVTGGKILAILWLIALMAFTGKVMAAFMTYSNWWAFSFLMAVVQLPSVAMAIMMVSADKPADYRRISRVIKGVMVLGVLSMIYVGVMLGKYA